MFIQQFFVTGLALAHGSYLLGGAETCAIIDLRRDFGIYPDAAAWGGFGTLTFPELFRVNPWVIIVPLVIALVGALYWLERAGL